jgi:hypothetical protein
MAQAMLSYELSDTAQHVRLITQNFPTQSRAIRHLLYALALNGLGRNQAGWQ